MKRLLLPCASVLMFASTAAFAHGGWDDGDYRYSHRHHRHNDYTVSYRVAPAPVVIYQSPPVMYRERIVYREPAPYYDDYYSRRSYPGNTRYGNDRLAGQAIGAIAGGVIGNQIGHGDSRVLSTAVGAVIGGAIGGNVAGR